MVALVVYDSLYGNTERIAAAISAALGSDAKRIGDVTHAEVALCDLLVVGSPTHAGRPSVGTKAFLRAFPDGVIEGKAVAAFDTRISVHDSTGITRLFARLFGYAAPRLARDLQRRGGIVGGEPAGFLVLGKEGPLKEGEEARAKTWARALLAAERRSS